MRCLGKIGEDGSWFGACGEKLDGIEIDANFDCMACIAAG
jgi:hypothetical protein